MCQYRSVCFWLLLFLVLRSSWVLSLVLVEQLQLLFPSWPKPWRYQWARTLREYVKNQKVETRLYLLCSFFLRSETYLIGSKMSCCCCWMFSTRPLEPSGNCWITTISSKSPSSILKKDFFIRKAWRNFFWKTKTFQELLQKLSRWTYWWSLVSPGHNYLDPVSSASPRILTEGSSGVRREPDSPPRLRTFSPVQRGWERTATGFEKLVLIK